MNKLKATKLKTLKNELYRTVSLKKFFKKKEMGTLLSFSYND